MAWLALLPGRLLERRGNTAPRGMIARRLRRRSRPFDKTRLIGELPFSRQAVFPHFGVRFPTLPHFGFVLRPNLHTFLMKLRYLP